MVEPGTKVGHYEIVESIGAGGMGEVYRARDTKLGREVAIKVLPDELAHDRERLSRFEREAKLLAGLNHPGIATLYGVEEHDGKPFLVMELVDGETLAERIARGRVPVTEAISLFVRVAEALEAAHGKGVIHRDLKPANVKITSEGVPKLLDFGLARAFHDETTEASTSQSPTLTKDTALGTILGTAAYMSPEQARGKSVDKRTDNWAFGCCLYEALTGKAVFRAETVSDTIANVLQREPDWSSVPSDTPSTVRDLLEWCLEKDPKRRLRDIGDALRLLSEETSSPTPTPKAVWWSTFLRWSAPALLIGALVTSWMSRRPDEPSRPVVRFIAKTIPFQSYIGGEGILDISPDGARLAYVDDNDADGAPQLFVRRLDETTATPIREAIGVFTPSFSPDGKSIAFFAQGGSLMTVSLQGGAPVSIADASSPRGADWSEDGVILFNFREAIWQVPSSGGEPRRVTDIDRTRKERSHRYPYALPDGRGILYSVDYASTDSWDDASINYASLESGASRTLIEGGTAPRYVPTGHIVFARAGSLFAVPFDLETLAVEGSPTLVVENVQMNPLSGSARFAISATGTLAHVRGGSQPSLRRLVWVDREGNVEPLPLEPLPFMRAELSPDGSSMAVDIESARGDIWLYDMARDVRTRLTFEWLNLLVGWHPDGRHVIFRTSAGTENWLSQVAADGSGSIERLGTAEETVRYGPSAWSPDGKHLAYEKVRSSGSDIWILSQEEKNSRPFLETEYDEQQPMFSPDGRFLAYVSDESGTTEVYVRPFPSGDRKWRISTGGGIEPRWSHDGSQLFFRDYGGEEVWVTDVSTDPEFRPGRARLLFKGKFSTYALSGPSYSLHPDGERFLMLQDVLPEPAPIVITLNWFEELERLVPTP